MAGSRMSSEHKAALAEGREDARAVKRYLEALSANAPRRGRPRTEQSIRNRLAVIDDSMQEVSSLKALQLVQERLDLQAELAARDESQDLTEVESNFVAHASRYSERKGISYAAWREVGVPYDVLRRAGVTRK